MLLSNIGRNNFIPKLLNSTRFCRSNRRIFINREAGNLETRHEIIIVIIVLIFSSSLCSSQNLVNITGRFISLFLLLLFKQLFCTKFKNGIKLIFAERLSFRGPSITSFQNSSSRSVHSLNDQMIQNHLLLCSLNNILLNTALGDKSVDIDLLLLTDSVSSGHGLKIILRIPVAVKDDDGVGCGQVDTETPGSGGKQKYLALHTK